MPEKGIRCDQCGELSLDHEWCENCGAPLDAKEEIQPTTWLAPESNLAVEHDDWTGALVIRDVIEDFATRKVFTAEMLEGPDNLKDALFFVEESEYDGRDPGEIPEEIDEWFRQPFHRARRGDDHIVEIYADVGGMTLEDLADIANGQLSYRQIRDVFESVATSVTACHSAGYMVLAIAPWTVRVDGFNAAFAASDTSPNVQALEPKPASSDDEEAIVEEATGDKTLSPWDVTDDDFLDEESEEEMFSGFDVMGETGILPLTAISEGDATLRAMFEGLDRAYPIGKNPDEVPVIMGFSPPELLGRVRADVTEACDVFGLGMLLYYLVAGRTPPASVYTRYSPSLPMRNFRPGFPPGLQPIVSRATRPNPEDRYPTVNAMMDAFRSACALMERRASHVGTSQPPRFRLAVDTHVGIAKGRRNPVNQDSVFGRFSDDGRFALVVVADGVSTASYGSGDLASHSLTRQAVDTWEELLPAYLMDERIDEIQVISDLLAAANEDIVDYVNEHHSPFVGNPHEVMGTTCLVAILNDGVVTLASLGDSRVYLQNSAGVEQITTDHNLWSLSVIDGVPADSALAMPHGDALARCLGTFSIQNGELDAVRPEADFFRFNVTRGDNLLLTTDGLVDFAGPNTFAAEENILSVLVAEPDPALACLELILLANRGGGGDNIGVGIAQFF